MSPSALMSSLRTLVVGVGGPTSSGKTTLAKHLLALLPKDRGIILHQDDFALPEAELPWNETLQARDWDSPIGTIDYRRLESVLQHARLQGELPPHHSSHDHLNEQPEQPIDANLAQDARRRLADALASSSVDRVILADGFLLYYDEAVRQQMDVRLFLRTPKVLLEKRRLERAGYATAEGTVWQDPPGYFEHVIWPGYVQAHKAMFENDDIEHGAVVKVDQEQKGDGVPVKDLVVMETESLHINDIVRTASQQVEQKLLEHTKKSA